MDSKSLHGTREIIGFQKERHQNPKWRRPLLCTCHRDYESLLWPLKPSPWIWQSASRKTPSSTTSPGIPLQLGCTQRPLRATRSHVSMLSHWPSDCRPFPENKYQINFKGPRQEKQVILIKVGEHYHGCNSQSLLSPMFHTEPHQIRRE